MTSLAQSEATAVEIFPIREPDSLASTWAARAHRLWVRMLSPARYDRLEGSIQIARAEIAHRFEPPAGAGPDQLLAGPNWKDAALSLLAAADCALARGRLDQAWKLLHAARRMEIVGMHRVEVAGLAATLRAEAEKLKSWRQIAVHTLLGTTDKPLGRLTTAALLEAVLLRDEYYNNQGYKDQLVRTQILFLALILAAVMAGIMGLAYTGFLPQGAPMPRTFHSLLSVMLFGNLGATVSAMLRASDTTFSPRIPEITATTRVTFMRIVMGGASAVIIYIALQSQLTGLFNDQLADMVKNLAPQTAYIVAFVAGFSERLVLQTVEYIAGKQPAAGDKTKTPDKG